MTLYDLTQQMEELLAMLEELPEQDKEDADTQEQAIRDTLEMVSMDFAEKADGYGKVLCQLQAEADAVKTQKMRLAARQSAIEKNIDRLKDAMLNAMIQIGQKKLKTDLFTFSTRAGQDLVITADSVFEIPDDYLRYKDPEPDKIAIKKYLKEHPEEEISWAHLVDTQSLTIR